MGGARNAGLKKVRTPFVLFLDADDRLVPGALEALLRPFRSCPDLITHAMRMEGLDVTSGVRGPWGFPPARAFRLQRSPVRFAVANTMTNLLPTVGSAVHRTEPVRLAGGFSDSNHGEDWGLSAILPFLGRVLLSEEVGLVLRVRPDSLTTKNESWPAVAASRREVRRRLRATSEIAPAVRAATPLLAPVHLITALRRMRHRHARALRRHSE